MSNKITIEAATRGLAQVLKEMSALAKTLKNLENQNNQTAGAQNTQASASRNQARAANDASEAVGGLANTHRNAARQMSELAKSSSAAVAIAYAEIAATVFSLSAAFTFLKDAANYEAMIETQRTFARETGVNMALVAKSIINATDASVDLAHASQLASIGKTAGFNTEQIEKLAKVAKSAATVLGRDIPESLDRVFKGVAKGEPEILDELGIFIKLDQAQLHYANKYNLKVQQLTTYQKTQATYMEAMVKAQQAYGAVIDKAATNPFAQAQASFIGSVKELTAAFTTYVAPFVSYLAANKDTLAAIALIFGGGAIKSASSALFMPKNVEERIKGMQAIIKGDRDARASIAASMKDRMPTNLTDKGRQQAVQSMVASTIAFSDAISKMGLKTSSEIHKINEDFKKGLYTTQEYMDKITKATANGKTLSQTLTRQAAILSNSPNSSTKIGGKVVDNAEVLAAANALERYSAASAKAAGSTLTLKNAFELTKLAAKGLTIGLEQFTTQMKLFFTTILKGVEWVGRIVSSLFSWVTTIFMVYEGLKLAGDYFGLFTKGIDEVTSSVTNATKALENSNIALQKHRDLTTFEGNQGSVEAYANRLDTLVDSLNEMAVAASKVDPGKLSNTYIPFINSASAKDVKEYTKLLEDIPLDDFNKLSKGTQDAVRETIKVFKSSRVSEVTYAQSVQAISQLLINDLPGGLQKSADKAMELAENLKNVASISAQIGKSYKAFTQESSAKSPYDDLLQQYRSIQTELNAGGSILKLNMSDNDQKALKAVLLQTSSIREEWSKDLPADSLNGFFGLSKGFAILRSNIDSTLKDLTSARRAFIDIQLNTERSVLAQQQWGEKFSGSAFDVSKLVSAKVAISQLSGEIQSLEQRKRELAKAPDDMFKAEALKTVNSQLANLNLKYEGIITNAKSSAKTMAELVLGSPEETDKEFAERIADIRNKAKSLGVASLGEEIVQKAKVDRLASGGKSVIVLKDLKKSLEEVGSQYGAATTEIQKYYNMLSTSNYSEAERNKLKTEAQDLVLREIGNLDTLISKSKEIFDLEQSRLKIMRDMADASKDQALNAKLASSFKSDSYIQTYTNAVSTLRSSGRSTQDAKLDEVVKLIEKYGVTGDATTKLPAMYNDILRSAKALQEASSLGDIEAEAKARLDYNRAIEDTRAKMHMESDSRVTINKVLLDAIKARSDESDELERQIALFSTLKDSTRTLFDGLLNPGNGNLSKAAGEAKDKLLGGLKKDLGDKMFGKAKTQINDVLGKLPGLGSTIGKIGSLGKFLGEFKGGGILAGIGSILSGDKGAGVGQILGTIVGGPIGALIGGALLSGFGKKVLKETGIIAKVSAEGVLSAQQINVYKKKGLSGSKTINEIVGNISSDAQMALQDAIYKIRGGFVSNMKQLSIYTSGALKYNQDLFSKFTYSGKFLVGAGGDTSALFDKVKDAYGNSLVTQISPLIKAFQIANESLASTLERITHVVKVTDNTFNAVFFKSSGKGLASILGDSYIKQFSIERLNSELVTYVGKVGNTGLLRSRTRLKESIAAPLYNLIGNSIKGVMSKEEILKAYSEQYDRLNRSSDSYSESKRTNAVNELSKQYDIYEKQYQELTDRNIMFIDFLANGASDASNALRELARLDFYNKMFQAFEGSTVDEKRKNFDEAMGKYADSVGSSLETLAGSFSQLAIELETADGLPETVKAAADGVITPIFVFNEQLKKAIENGASPAEVAKAIQTGAKLGDVIQSILQVFSSINISNVSTKADFITNIISGVTDTFKTSLLDQFKKTLVTPILGGILNGTGNTGLSASDIASAGDSLVARAKELIGVLNNSNTSSALGLVGTEFERLMKLFGSLDVATSMSNINKAIKDITADLKQSAFDFLTGGDTYSGNLFKATELFKSAGLSGDLSTKPLKDTFEIIKGMISTGAITADSLDAVSSALKAMAEATKAARQQIADTVTATKSLMDDTFSKIKDISISIAEKSGDLGKAKTIFADLLKYPSEQLAKAREAYAKAKTSGNLLSIANAGATLSGLLSNYMSDQITMQETLQRMEQEKYDSEKQAIQDITDWTKELADFAKSLKFDEKLSILAPINRLSEASKSFDQLKAELITKSTSKTLNAGDIKSIQEQGRQLLELGRDVYASGDQYTALYNEVQSLISTTSANLAANQTDLTASTQAYQDSSLAYAQQLRDIQLSTLEELKSIGTSAAYDNAISTQLLDAIKFNQSIPSGLSLSDYYAQLFATAQSGLGTFTNVGSGFPDFTQGTATQQQPDGSTSPTTPDLNERLVSTLERLELILATLPLGIKSAVVSQQTAATRS